jgi:hypothetical protein
MMVKGENGSTGSKICLTAALSTFQFVQRSERSFTILTTEVNVE